MGGVSSGTAKRANGVGMESGNAAIRNLVPAECKFCQSIFDAKRRLTNREPAMPNRHGISMARVMPMRGPTTISARPVRAFKRNGGLSNG